MCILSCSTKKSSPNHHDKNFAVIIKNKLQYFILMKALVVIFPINLRLGDTRSRQEFAILRKLHFDSVCHVAAASVIIRWYLWIEGRRIETFDRLHQDRLSGQFKANLMQPSCAVEAYQSESHAAGLYLESWPWSAPFKMLAAKCFRSQNQCLEVWL